MDASQNPTDGGGASIGRDVTSDDSAAAAALDKERPAKDSGSSWHFPSIRRRGPNLRFTDHFTLRLPTSDVKYRGDFIHVYDLRTSQIQLFVTANGTEQSLNEGAVNSALNHPSIDERQQQQSGRSGNDQGTDEEAQMNKQSPTSEDAHVGDDNINEQQQQPQVPDIQVRHVPNDRGTGLNLLRLMYTVIALFFSGIVSPP